MFVQTTKTYRCRRQLHKVFIPDATFPSYVRGPLRTLIFYHRSFIWPQPTQPQMTDEVTGGGLITSNNCNSIICGKSIEGSEVFKNNNSDNSVCGK